MNLKYLSFIPLLLIGVTGCDTPFNSGLTDQEIVEEVASKGANAQTSETHQISGGQKTIKGMLIEESETDNNVNIIYRPADRITYTGDDGKQYSYYPIGSITATTIYVNSWFILNIEEPDRKVIISWNVDSRYFSFKETTSDIVSQSAIRPIKENFPELGNEPIRTILTATFRLNDAVKVNRYLIDLTTVDYGDVK